MISILSMFLLGGYNAATFVFALSELRVSRCVYKINNADTLYRNFDVDKYTEDLLPINYQYLL